MSKSKVHYPAMEIPGFTACMRSGPGVLTTLDLGKVTCSKCLSEASLERAPRRPPRMGECWCGERFSTKANLAAHKRLEHGGT